MLKSVCSSCLLVLAFAAPVFARQPASPAVIVTTGEGSVKLAPDRVWVTVGAESRARTAPDAQRANTDAMTAVIDRIKAAGIPAEAIQTSAYNVQPEFDYANGKQTLRGYVSRNQVQVRVDTLAKTGDILSAAVATGATTVNGVRFDLKNRDDAERDALSLAVRDARRRADSMATAASVQIERVIRIEEQRDGGDIVRPMPMAMMKAEAGPVPIEAGEIEVRARVTMTAAIR